MANTSGRHFLQIPGPTNVPDRVLRAIDNPTMDHRGPAFGELSRGLLADIKKVFKTESHVIIYPASGTGAWEAALVNTLSPGDRVLMYETGQFATLWQGLAKRLDLVPEFVAGDWRHGVDPAAVEERLAADTGHEIKAVCMVHNETSTGVLNPLSEIAAVVKEFDDVLLVVDTVSSFSAVPIATDTLGIDVLLAGVQKAMALPPASPSSCSQTRH